MREYDYRRDTIEPGVKQIQVRDVRARICHLEQSLEDLDADYTEREARGDWHEDEQEAREEERGELHDELKVLQELDGQLTGVADDVPLYCADWFEDVAQDVAESLHGPDFFTEWPFSCIDWGNAADELRDDYTPVEFGGYTYLYMD